MDAFPFQANRFKEEPQAVLDWIEYGGTTLSGFALLSATFSWIVIVPGFPAWIFLRASTTIDWRRLAVEDTLRFAAAQVFALRGAGS